MTSHPRTFDPSNGSARDLSTLFRCCSAGDSRARRSSSGSCHTRQLARRYERRGEIAEDLYQAASEGLIKAVDRYQPERGVSFMSYAEPMILGEIRRHFRDRTWRVHVPRSMEERAVRLARASAELSASRGADETMVIATHLGIEPGEIDDARLVLEAYRPRSLDAEYEREDGQRQTLGESVGEWDRGYEQVEDLVEFRRMLEKLGPRDREVLLLRVHFELTQAEIARRIGVSQMQASRILRKSIRTTTAPTPAPGATVGLPEQHCCARRSA
jgi:RNA polymerase sigma-B factor